MGLSEQRAIPAEQALPPWSGKLLKYAKHLIYLAGTEITGIIYEAFVTGGPMNPATSTDPSTGGDMWTRWRLDWADTASLDSADTQSFTLDIVNYTDGAVDSSWTDADFVQVRTNLYTFATRVAALSTSRHNLKRISAYLMGFNPYGNLGPDGKPGPPFVQSGGPAYIFNTGLAGGGAPTMPPQIRLTVTEETPSRRHWGRIYLPTPNIAQFTALGRVTNSAVDEAANAYDELAGLLQINDFFPVVPTTMAGGVPKRTLQVVSGVRCDDVADVQRSGRFHQAKYHHIVPTPTATVLPAEDDAA